METVKGIHNFPLNDLYNQIEWIKNNLIDKEGIISLNEGLPTDIKLCKISYAYKIYEMSTIAVKSIEKGYIVAAMALTREISYSTLVLEELSNKIYETLETNEPGSIQQFLMSLVAAQDTKIIKEIISSACGSSHDIKKSDEIQSEFAHPNPLGITGIYTHENHDNNYLNIGHQEKNNQECVHCQLNIAMKDTCIIHLKEALGQFIASYLNIKENIDELRSKGGFSGINIYAYLMRFACFPFEDRSLRVTEEDALKIIYLFIDDLKFFLTRKIDINLFQTGIAAQAFHYKITSEHRLYDLGLVALTSIEGHKVITAMCIIKSLMETIFGLTYLNKEIERALRNKKIDRIRNQINKLTSGSRLQLIWDSNHATKSIHTEDFLEIQDEPIRMLYAFICTSVRLGNMQFYAGVNDEKSLINIDNTEFFNQNKLVMGKKLCISVLANTLSIFGNTEKLLKENIIKLNSLELDLYKDKSNSNC